ncbi:L-threonylcarbamoyladenylate synthase [Algoriphagus halophytocola]|uniref:L-threonylcarbamoyladenylate synthase n=1 Tax=Algoriphagus halophytocola TaxID=2991499 RepID=UPI0022DDDB13|nr:L-threonylcarbamoyladenylate synthase [Algoriphagus sp. TR-M9]WBL41990.1 L-threonylcarbamoyladenylate synthase [Algoriphagus sp. TR-M9]
MALIGKDIAYAKQVLDSGELVAIPTETVYGLAGNALDAKAVASIFETKNRPSFDPLIIHVASVTAVEQYVSTFPEKLKALADKFWPGPLTLLLSRKEMVPDLVTSGLPRVAVRVPDHSLTRSLLSELDYPLAAPSANPFGYISPTQPAHVQLQLGDKINYILDGGACKVGLESTIVGMEGEDVVIYRLGGLEVSEIEQVVGSVKIQDHSSSNPQSPGLLESHYAPRKPFLLGNLQELISRCRYEQRDFAVLSFDQEFQELPKERQIALSPTGDLREAAANLFAAMRKLDQSDAAVILAEKMPAKGLGLAINDRLKRAAAQG